MKVTIAALTALTLVSCSKENPSPQVIEDNLVPIKLNLNAQDQVKDSWSDTKKGLFNSINSKQKADYTVLNDLFILKHIENYSNVEQLNLEDVQDSFKQELSDLMKDMPAGKGLEELKVNYEEIISSDLNKEIDYDPDKFLMPALTKEASLQCHSGSAFHQTIARKYYSKKDFQKLNFVMIHEPGHVLPGIIKMTDQGAVLEGIETTAAGEAIIEYGLLDRYNECLQVVDSNHYFVAKIFEKDITNPNEVKQKSLEFTGSKYGFDFKRLQALCPTASQVMNVSSATAQKSKANSSSLFTVPGKLRSITKSSRTTIKRSRKPTAQMPVVSGDHHRGHFKDFVDESDLHGPEEGNFSLIKNTWQTDSKEVMWHLFGDFAEITSDEDLNEDSFQESYSESILDMKIDSIEFYKYEKLDVVISKKVNKKRVTQRRSLVVVDQVFEKHLSKTYTIIYFNSEGQYGGGYLYSLILVNHDRDGSFRAYIGEGYSSNVVEAISYKQVRPIGIYLKK